MRYMQVIEATDQNEARQSYMELLRRRGVAPTPRVTIIVETVHRPQAVESPAEPAWLCYLAGDRQQAA